MEVFTLVGQELFPVILKGTIHSLLRPRGIFGQESLLYILNVFRDIDMLGKNMFFLPCFTSVKNAVPDRQDCQSSRERVTVVPPASFHLFVGHENWKAPYILSVLALYFSRVSWKIHWLPLGSPCWLDPKQAIRPSNSYLNIFQSLA